MLKEWKHERTIQKERDIIMINQLRNNIYIWVLLLDNIIFENGLCVQQIFLLRGILSGQVLASLFILQIFFNWSVVCHFLLNIGCENHDLLGSQNIYSVV